MENDERGEVGQTEFAAWCAQNSMTAVPAVPDKFGWDFHVTLKETGEERGPYEVRGVERQCKAQVKVSVPGAKSVSIRLTNLERMAKEHVPWIVVVYPLALTEKKPKDAFLVHVGKALIEKTLERLMQERMTPSGMELNDIHLTVPFGEDERVPDGEELRRRLRELLLDSETHYADTKRRWIDGAGYEEHPIRASFTVAADTREDLLEMVSDWAIGHLKTLPIDAFEAAKVRFGFAERMPPTEGAVSAHVEVQPPSIGVTAVTLANREESRCIHLACETFTTHAVAPDLPPKYRKMRLAASFISFLLIPLDESFLTLRLTFSIPSDRCSLAELAKVAQVIALCGDARTDGAFATFAFENGRTTKHNLGDIHEKLDPEFLRFARVALAATTIATAYGVDLATLVVQAGELLHREFDLTMLASGLEKGEMMHKLQIATGIPASIRGERAALVFDTLCTLGDFVVSGVITLVGVATWAPLQGSQGLVGIEQPEITVRARHVRRRDSWLSGTLRLSVQEVVTELEAKGIKHVFANAEPAELEAAPPSAGAVQA